MLQLARTVIGYHGCASSFAQKLMAGGAAAISSWQESNNAYDWLGRGIYFWEDGAPRALRWATEQAKRRQWKEKPAVVGAIIRLGACMDLLNEQYTALLGQAHGLLASEFIESEKALPANRGGTDLVQRDLDCLVINYAVEYFEELKLQTVRGAFLEGPEIYPGTLLKQHTHIQIAVRDRSCILGVFIPNL